MRYSVRLLLATFLLVAVLIQLTQAIIDKEEIELLEAALASEVGRTTKLRSGAESRRSRRKQYGLCEMVLEDSLVPLEAYLATKTRFEMLQRAKVKD